MSYLRQLEPLDQYNLDLQANVHPTDWQNPVADARYNLVVIGAGTAGLVTAAGAAGLGAKVALVERGLMGGDCLNVGCVPSKALISASRQAANLKNLQQWGVRVDNPRVDFAEVMLRMRRLRAEISPHDSARRFTELGIDVYFGQGRFTGTHSMEVNGQTLHFKRAVIATGARAAEPKIPGLNEVGYLTNETVFSLTELPPRLVVIGGGPIGCEMAQCFAGLGSQVTQIEKADRILPREERDAAQVVQTAMARDGVQFVLNAQVIRAESRADDQAVIVKCDDQELRIPTDRILLGVGRTPNLDGLGLDAAGVDYDPKLGVVVDARLRTSNPNIYAAGDVCSQYKFTHAADFLARIAIQNTLFLGRAKASDLIIPWCTYTSPELAHVGIYPQQALEEGIELACYHQPLSNVDRAILDGHDQGFVRIYCRQGSDKIVGATLVAPHAGDLIGEVAIAMKNRIGLAKIASTIHPYPTHAEAIRKLGDQYNRTRLTPWVKWMSTKWLAWTR